MHGQDLLGLRMKTIIKAFAGTKALPERFPPKTAQPSRVIGPNLNVLLADRAFQHRSRFWHLPRRLQRVSLHHLPHRRGDGDGRAVRIPVRALDHRSSAAAAGQGSADPHRRPAIASDLQEGHADDGRADDPVRPRGLDAAVGQSAQPLCLDRAGGDARLRLRRFLRRLSEGDQTEPQRLRRQAAAADRGGDCAGGLLRAGAARPRRDVDVACDTIPEGRGDQFRLVLRDSSARSSSSAPAMR